jgi:hypothetical protein
VTVHLVDQQRVASGDADAFTALVHEQGVPLMEGAGVTFVSCDASTNGPDDTVDVLTVWEFDDFVAWNRIRRDLLFDARYGPYAAGLAALRRGGTRRFYPRAPIAEARVDTSTGGPALRRWEMFSVDRAADPAAVAAMRRAMQECDRHITGISRCAVGTNSAGPPIEVVWETTYASVAAYGAYMTHPYHASVLDRYLLPDCPERVTTHNDLGAGLIGYATDLGRPSEPVAVRRLLLLDFHRAPDAAEHWRDEVAAAAPEPTTSVLAENTMSTRWFDGVTDMGGRPAWSHLWDQCFPSVDALEEHRAGTSASGRVERAMAADAAHAPARSAEIVYLPELSAAR